jgi:uncharacterized protein (DUF433 family)
MQIEDYFDFLASDDIRLKGTRVGIETILYDYIYRQGTPESIAQSYPTVTLEQVYATILYYLHDQDTITAYIADWLEWGEQMRSAQRHNPSPAAEKLRKARAERDAKLEINESEVSFR